MKTFFKRTFSTILLLSLLAGSIFCPAGIAKTIFALLVILLSYFAVREFTVILKQSGNPADTVLTPIITALTAVFALPGLYIYCFIMAGIFAVQNWALFLTSENREMPMRRILNSSAAYLMFCIPIVMMVWIYNIDPFLFLYLIIVTKISDIGAYVTGTVSNAVTKGGNHKMIPQISPGKSYEGAVGGIVCAVAASLILWHWTGLEASFWLPLLGGVILFFGSMAGDLAESAFKRTCGVKDSGSLLPGIGGIFDLVDSMLINSVLFFFFLYFTGPA